MSWKTKLPICIAVAATAIALNFGGVATPALAEEVVLHMAVPDWPPTRIMKDLFVKNYKSPSGNHVKLDIDFIPWPDYYTRLNTSLSRSRHGRVHLGTHIQRNTTRMPTLSEIASKF